MKIKGVLALATAILILCVIYAANVQMFHIKTSSLSENNTWDEIAEGTKAREEVGSDFYSPLLHHSAEGYASGEGLRLNTDFGLYEIR